MSQRPRNPPPFSHPVAAKRALQALNGILFCGRHLRYDELFAWKLFILIIFVMSITIRVGWATFRNKKEPKTHHHDRMDSASVHISFISNQVSLYFIYLFFFIIFLFIFSIIILAEKIYHWRVFEDSFQSFWCRIGHLHKKVLHWWGNLFFWCLEIV